MTDKYDFMCVVDNIFKECETITDVNFRFMEMQKALTSLFNQNVSLKVLEDKKKDGLNEAQDLYALQIKNEIKFKAVKEFAERLCNSSIVIENPLGQKYRVVTTLVIDNLVKEMTEGTE